MQGFKVGCLGVFGLRVKGSGCRVQRFRGFGLRVKGSGFRDLGLGVKGLGYPAISSRTRQAGDCVWSVGFSVHHVLWRGTPHLFSFLNTTLPTLSSVGHTIY